MADPNRSIWQVVGVCVAASWICLQVVDLLADHFPLPTWLFPFTFVLLSIGLVDMTATAAVQARAVRGHVPGHRLLTWRNAGAKQD